MYPEFTHLKSTTSQRSKIVRLIPLQSFELIIIYLKKCVQRGLKKYDYILLYRMNMNDNNYMTTLPKRDLKTSSYKMNMNKKDLKKLSKSQLIKLFLKQEKNGRAQKPIPPPRTGKWESVKPKPVL